MFWVHLPNKTETQKPIVEASHLTWWPSLDDEPVLPNKTEPRPLLAQLSFAIASGERVLLTGPSGSGKSTLLRAIANVLAQTEAGVFSGQLFVRARTGLVLQDSANSFVAATLGGEVAFGPENLALAEPEIRKRVSQAVADVALPYAMHRSTVELSGGESQRMQLAAVLALEPQLLLLDEPLSMLDAAAAAKVLAAIEGTLAAEPTTAAIIVDHDASAWSQIVSRVLVLSADGRLVRDEPISQFLADARLAPDLASVPELASVPKLTSSPKPVAFDLGYRAHKRQATIKAFIGPSGAGKTTELQKLLATLPVAQVGFVPQQPEFTVAGNTVWRSATATAKNLGLETTLASALLSQLGLTDKLSLNPYRLSGGELRRLALVSALAHYPRILILDEPTVGQDAETWQAVAGVILAAREAGIEVVLATHDAALIALADEVVEVSPKPQTQTAPPKRGRIAPLVALGISFGLLAGSLSLGSVATALTAVAIEFLVALACWRILPAQRIKRFVPILIALASIWVSNSLFAAGGISTAGFERATVIALRVAFFALPSVALAGALRPAELAAALVRWLHMPARPAVAAAAALVRLEFIGWQWAAVRQARRLRGFSEGRGSVSRSREFMASLFALLVQSLRGAGELAVAMQARGFGEPTAKRRTWVRF